MEKRVKLLLGAVAEDFPEKVRFFGNILNSAGRVTNKGVTYANGDWNTIKRALAINPILRAEAERLLPTGAEVALGVISTTLDLPPEAFPDDV
jgi:hypothetical protein